MGEDKPRENTGASIPDRLRRNRERVEMEAFARLKTELIQAFAAPETACKPRTAAEVIARSQARTAVPN